METNDKRTAILNAASELFATQGFNNTKMIDIAEKAGIGKGTIYEYFTSKESLFSEFIKCELLDFYEDVKNNILSKNQKASETLREFFRNESQKFCNYAKTFRLLENSLDTGIFKSSDIHKTFFEIQFCRFVIVKSIIEEGISRGEFKSVNADAASVAALGALSAYLVSTQDFSYIDDYVVEPREPFDIDEFLYILIYGLKK
ncbi:MAG: TetR/AcrR family transcriptional regulator [Clostridiales bacterium]|nr:TetR/AcrR family transcriptional regulator [Clostridiales bacterium]